MTETDSHPESRRRIVGQWLAIVAVATLLCAIAAFARAAIAGARGPARSPVPSSAAILVSPDARQTLDADRTVTTTGRAARASGLLARPDGASPDRAGAATSRPLPLADEHGTHGHPSPVTPKPKTPR